VPRAGIQLARKKQILIFDPRFFGLFCSALFLVVIGSLSPRPAKITPKDAKALEVMNDAVKWTVERTKTDVVGQGSWVSRAKYAGPLGGGTSDHDMRVLVPGETDSAALVGKWNIFQNELKDNIRKAGRAKGLAKGEIDKLVQSTNVYPPNQITNSFENADDAASFFARHGHPGLDNAPTDGIFSAGGQAFRQGKEVTNGKLWRYDPSTGKAVKTSTDLTLMTEGYEKFYTAGEAASARHWAEEIAGDLAKGDMRALEKHAERLRTSINKARNLERVGMRADYLDDIVRGEIKDPSAIRDLLARAKQDADLLLALSKEASSRNRGMIIGFLNENLGQWAKMRNAFWNMASEIPVGKLLTAFQIYTYYARTMDLAKITDAKEFNAAVLRNAALDFGWAAGPVAGLSAEIADAVLTGAREGAFQIVVAFQECADLVAGVHSVKGREELVPGMSIEQLAKKYADTEEDRRRLDNFIKAQAAQASSRLEKNIWVHDPNIERALYGKCKDSVFAKWYDKRLDMIDEFNKLFSEWVNIMYAGQAALTLRPDTDEIVLKTQPGGLKSARVRIVGSITENPGKIEDLKNKMNVKLTALEGERRQPVLSLNSEFKLSLNGRRLKAAYNPEEIVFDLVVDKPGEYTVRLDHEYALTAIFFSEDIGQYTPFITQQELGFTKKYLKQATLAFSVVEEEAPPKEAISIKPKPGTTDQKDQASGGKTPTTAGSKTKTATTESILAEYRSLYPAYLQKLYPRTSIEMKANAAPSGNEYLCSYIAWGIIQDGPRKGERYKVVDFSRPLTLAALESLIPEMKKALGR
jgi:hypothetical protein